MLKLSSVIERALVSTADANQHPFLLGGIELLLKCGVRPLISPMTTGLESNKGASQRGEGATILNPCAHRAREA